jgi:cytochrome c556
MRVAMFVAALPLALLAGCGEQGTTANKTQANASSNATAEAKASPLGAPLSGDEAKEMMHERHEGMEDIGDGIKALKAALEAPTPDLATVRKEAAELAKTAPDVSGWFRPGTGPEMGKTHAKPEIWQKPDDFAARTRDFQAAAQKLDAAAQGNDVAAMKSAFADVGKSCKACHDPYRRPLKGH